MRIRTDRRTTQHQGVAAIVPLVIALITTLALFVCLLIWEGERSDMALTAEKSRLQPLLWATDAPDGWVTDAVSATQPNESDSTGGFAQSADVAENIQLLWKHLFAVDDSWWASYAEQSTAVPSPGSVLLDVPLVSQLPDYPSGCELASTTMLLNYHGMAIDIRQVADTIPRSADGDPANGFVGDPTLENWSWNNGSGWTIYPEKLAEYLNQQMGFAGSLILTAVSPDSLKSQIRTKNPVLIWLYDPEIGMHNVVLTGFDAQGYYVNDPYGSKNRYLENEVFLAAWNGYANMALGFAD